MAQCVPAFDIEGLPVASDHGYDYLSLKQYEIYMLNVLNVMMKP